MCYLTYKCLCRAWALKLDCAYGPAAQDWQASIATSPVLFETAQKQAGEFAFSAGCALIRTASAGQLIQGLHCAHVMTCQSRMTLGSHLAARTSIYEEVGSIHPEDPWASNLHKTVQLSQDGPAF